MLLGPSPNKNKTIQHPSASPEFTSWLASAKILRHQKLPFGSPRSLLPPRFSAAGGRDLRLPSCKVYERKYHHPNSIAYRNRSSHQVFKAMLWVSVLIFSPANSASLCIVVLSKFLVPRSAQFTFVPTLWIEKSPLGLTALQRCCTHK